ncbi:MAG: nicotinate (nicotinamide) nucleotide adenylyltransferase [Oscillospiraceae bacterium]
MDKIIVYGGTFDPIHKGHLNCINYILKKYDGYKIFIVPNGNPPHKINKNITNIKHRINMINLIIENLDNVFLYTGETKFKINYTIDTLRSIEKSYNATDIRLLIGSDSFLNIETWDRYEDILKNYKLIVFTRDICHKTQVQNKCFEMINKDIKIIDDDIFEITSSLIRNEIKNNLYKNEFIDENVIKYIKENNLYKKN